MNVGDKVQHRHWDGSDRVYGHVIDTTPGRALVEWADGSRCWHMTLALEPWVAEVDR